jgi:hypothetical protein
MSTSANIEVPFPPDLVRAVVEEAAQDADRVVSFLRHLGLDCTPDRPRYLPSDLLLALAAGLRLHAWEASGYTAHTDAGLPPALTVIRDAITSGVEPGRLDPRLPLRVLAVSVERFAWAARAMFSEDNLLAREATARRMEELRAELAGEAPTPVERLLAERAVACWLHLYHLENTYAGKASMTLDLGAYYQQCIDRAHKRYQSALKALAEVRRLALPALQVNIAKRQVNVAGGCT